MRTLARIVVGLVVVVLLLTGVGLAVVETAWAKDQIRELIDELLFRVRDANQHLDFWTPEERAAAEQELNTIMSRVRGAALHKTT